MLALHWMFKLNKMLILSCSRSVPECNSEDEKQLLDEAPVQIPSPLVPGNISSEDSEAEEPEELSEFPVSTAHPRPIAVSLVLFFICV